MAAGVPVVVVVVVVVVVEPAQVVVVAASFWRITFLFFQTYKVSLCSADVSAALSLNQSEHESRWPLRWWRQTRKSLLLGTLNAKHR